MFLKEPNKLTDIWATLVIKLDTETFQKLPNLVTLMMTTIFFSLYKKGEITFLMDYFQGSHNQ